MHYNGYNKEGKNHAQALEHFLQAASEGDSRAATAAGLMFHKGEGVARNVKTAMRWFEKASNAGEVRAMSVLCFMHYKGHVDETMDFLTAAKWCRKAADAGDHKAQFNLGVMAAQGQGLEQDFVASYQWLTLAMHSLPESALAARSSLVTKMTHAEVHLSPVTLERSATSETIRIDSSATVVKRENLVVLHASCSTHFEKRWRQGSTLQKNGSEYIGTRKA